MMRAFVAAIALALLALSCQSTPTPDVLPRSPDPRIPAVGSLPYLAVKRNHIDVDFSSLLYLMMSNDAVIEVRDGCVVAVSPGSKEDPMLIVWPKGSFVAGDTGFLQVIKRGGQTPLATLGESIDLRLGDAGSPLDPQVAPDYGWLLDRPVPDRCAAFDIKEYVGQSPPPE